MLSWITIRIKLTMCNLPQRKSSRLKEYDYSNSAYYFITICIHDKEYYFGNVHKEKMILNQYGIIAEECWKDLPSHYSNCELDYYVIMPNHVHGILVIDNYNYDKATLPQSKIHGITEIIRGYKTFSSKIINLLPDQEKAFRWQKSYYDRIIRNEKELHQIRKYIEQNPLRWDIEKNTPDNLDI